MGSEIKKRELIIKLNREGRSYREIGIILGVSKSTVYFWMARYRENGSFENKSRSGRPTILSKKKLHVIHKIIKQKIKGKTGLSSKDALSIIKKEVGSEYSLRHIQRILHRLNLSPMNRKAFHSIVRKKQRNKIQKRNVHTIIWSNS